MSSLDLDKLGSALAGERSDRGVGSGESSAALEVELRAAKNTIKNYHACLMLLLLVLIIAVDVWIFRSITAWAPVLAIALLEAVVVFLLAFVLGLTEIITLLWAGMRTYGKKDPGDPPNPA